MPRRILAPLCSATLVAAAMLVPLGSAPAGAVEDGTDPLKVTIESLTPAVLPKTGPIRISGTVTNLDEVTWTTINLYSFVSSAPMTTAAELSAAAELPPESTVGNRIADPEFSDTVDEIAPGDTVPFSFSVPRKQIPVSAPGVYWFGVQALGQGPDGRDDSADGRDRTFISLIAPNTPPLPSAVVLPLRSRLTYAADGSLDDVAGWVKTLSTGGRLRSLVDFGASADSRAVTWLVDPALIDAVRQLAAGNPPRSLEPTVVPGAPGGGGPVPEVPDPAPSVEAQSKDAAGAASQDPVTDEARTLATDWLDRLGRALPGHQVLALPYGDLDVAGAADLSPGTYAAARRRTGDTLAPYDVPVDPAVAAPGGFLDPAGIALSEPADTLLLTDTMFTGVPGQPTDPSGDVPTVATDGTRRIVVTASASTTGVGPGDLRSPLSLRQQLLAQAAVRTMSPDPQPLVVMLANDWNPVTSSGFFSGLDVSWLDLQSVGEVAARPATSVSVDDLYYPRAQDRSQVDRLGFAAAAELSSVGDQLENLLRDNDQVARTVRDEALASVSYTARSRPLTSRLAAVASTRWVQDRLRSVRIDAPTAFTMTGTEGQFSATVTNGLDQPVVVGVQATVTSGISITAPRTVEVPPKGRTRVLLNATAPAGGIHSVTLALTDTDGTPLGVTDELNVRSLAASFVIWLFLGAAGALLVGAIAFRLFKRVRAARRTTREAKAPPGPTRARVPAEATSGDS